MIKRRGWWVALALVAVLASAAALSPAPAVPPEPVARLWAWSVGGRYLGREGVSLQRGAWDCGVAALAMVLDAHRRAPRLEDVRGMVLDRGQGLTLLEIGEVAERRGLPAAGWRLEFAALARSPLPAIAHFADHYVVVDRIAPDGTVTLRDPAVGQLEMPRASFERLWTGNVLLFARPTAESGDTIF